MSARLTSLAARYRLAHHYLRVRRWLEGVQAGVMPLDALIVRLVLAQTFFVSGFIKLTDWDKALFLASNEYPVPWLAPQIAAALGAAIELGAATLLALGLATRLAAIAMLFLAVVIQVYYVRLDVHLFWIALFAWFIAYGPGAISLDAPLARGLARTALPFAGAAVRAGQWLTRYFAPVYKLALRLWIAAAIAGASFVMSGRLSMDALGEAGVWLPLKWAGYFMTGFEVSLALLIALGLATRVVAVLMLGVTFSFQMLDPWHLEYLYWFMTLSLLALHGPGKLSLDSLVDFALRSLGKPQENVARPRIVVIGAGFGGIACANGLTGTAVEVTLIDRQNYHLFQPLLYQIATASLAPGDVALPVRAMFREERNVRVLLGTVTGVDVARREVILGAQRIGYDYLVIAAGASHSYFGRDEWAPYAPGLKRIEDGLEVRRRMLLAFERAEACDDPAERERLLTFLIVGGGPTGVELAGAIAELARFGMERDFRRFDPARARVLLVQAGPRVLPAFAEALSVETQRALARLGVEVLVNARVEAIDAEGVVVSGQRIAARTVIWAAGVVASPAAKWLAAAADGAGRVKVAADLSVPGQPNVFVIGDTAACNAWNGKPVPGLAPAAKQQGQHVARLIRARVVAATGAVPFTRAFVYRHLGSLATIGRKSAVADFGFMRLKGALAWWFWGAIHVYFLAGGRNRISVMFDWFWAYLTFRGGTRLITGGVDAASALAPSDTIPAPEVVRVRAA